MSIFGSIVNLGKAAVDSALLPVDGFMDLVTGCEKNRVERRVDKIGRELDKATDESYEDDE